MSLTAETVVQFTLDQALRAVGDGNDRRADIERKQILIGEMLRELGCDGLLGTDPETFSWLTSGANPRGILDPEERPFIYFNPDQRWLIASNVDSQRFFDEELDGLGFQLKEWPWHWSREQLVADLTFGRKVACDRPVGSFTMVGDRLRLMRRVLSQYEQACLQVVGPFVSHALEATCRTLKPGETEREIAGQISHRLLHRGLQPLGISVSADGRSKRYRRSGFTSMQVWKYAVMTVTARKYGLCATASRSVSLGPPDAELRQEFDAAAKVMATYVASTWPDAMPGQILATGKQVYQFAGYEEEWRLTPQGFVTGRAPVEMRLVPKSTSTLHADSAITWNACIGAGQIQDTYLITEGGPKIMTPPELWPLKGIRVKGAEFALPDIFQH
jgi:Xaa-Pro aminopeptidase